MQRQLELLHDVARLDGLLEASVGYSEQFMRLLEQSDQLFDPDCQPEQKQQLWEQLKEAAEKGVEVKRAVDEAVKLLEGIIDSLEAFEGPYGSELLNRFALAWATSVRAASLQKDVQSQWRALQLRRLSLEGPSSHSEQIQLEVLLVVDHIKAGSEAAVGHYEQSISLMYKIFEHANPASLISQKGGLWEQLQEASKHASEAKTAADEAVDLLAEIVPRQGPFAPDVWERIVQARGAHLRADSQFKEVQGLAGIAIRSVVQPRGLPPTLE
jgi:hypothetical protein